MKHLDLFSGIGGFALACQWNRIETIGFVEIDKYCQKVLRNHWPDVPIVEDIRDVEAIKEIVANAQKTIGKQPRHTWSGRAGFTNSHTESRIGGDDTNNPAILITAGFPCQPFSVAGKQLSQADDRYLWPQTIAVIKEVEPKWVLLENVTGIINLALDTVLSDLEGAGYATETLIIPACAVNAWHRRDRIWVIAYSDGDRIMSWTSGDMEYNGDKPREHCSATREVAEMVAFSQGRESWQQTEPDREGLAIRQEPANRRGIVWQEGEASSEGDWWATEPELGRVANGIPSRVDRLKCLGNAIVPQVAYEIIKVIKQVSMEMDG